MRRATIALSVLLSLATAAMAQMNNEMCQLTISVRTSDDHEYTGRAQVELLSMSGTPVAASQTNGAGSADFQVPSGTMYRVRISAQDIETTTSEFRIYGGASVHTENVNVRSVTPAGQQQDASTQSPTVSIAEMNVPNKARDELKKGMEAFDKGDMEKAEQQFQKAIDIYPKYARAYTYLGVIAAKAGDRAKARTMLTKAVEIDDKFLQAYVDLARLDFQDKNYAECESMLRKALALNPNMADALALLASSEYVNKEYDKALADAQRTHTLPNHEEFAQVHLLAGKILEMQNKPQGAIAEYQIYLHEFPSSPQGAAIQQEIAQLQKQPR